MNEEELKEAQLNDEVLDLYYGKGKWWKLNKFLIEELRKVIPIARKEGKKQMIEDVLELELYRDNELVAIRLEDWEKFSKKLRDKNDM